MKATVKPKACKTCKVCKSQYQPRSAWQKACSVLCGLEIAMAVMEKRAKALAADDRRETRAKLERLKSRAKWMAETQQAFNAWVRARDAGRPCISCGRHHQGQYHAGHYLSVGARPELRFEPLNVWLQCAPCNVYLSGNAVLFRQALVREIGIKKVEWLEGPHEPQKYTIDQLTMLKKHYVAKRLQEMALREISDFGNQEQGIDG